MIALRQLKRVPKNHKIIIEVPDNIDENQIMEVILLFKIPPKNTKADKIAQLKNSQYDSLFLQDLQAINANFSDIDCEEWHGCVDIEHESWLDLSSETLEKSYAEEEEDYPITLIKEVNPDYERR